MAIETGSSLDKIYFNHIYQTNQRQAEVEKTAEASSILQADSVSFSEAALTLAKAANSPVAMSESGQFIDVEFVENSGEENQSETGENAGNGSLPPDYRKIDFSV